MHTSLIAIKACESRLFQHNHTRILPTERRLSEDTRAPVDPIVSSDNRSAPVPSSNIFYYQSSGLWMAPRAIVLKIQIHFYICHYSL